VIFRGHGADPAGRSAGRFDLLDTIFSPRRAADMATAVWGIVGLTAIAVVVLPHASGVRVAGWLGLGLAALTMAGVWHWKGSHLPRSVQFFASIAGVLGVGGAVASAHSTPTAFAGALLYITLTVYAASFYPDRALALYLAVLAATSGAALLTSSVPGSGAAWVEILLTTAAVAGCIRALEHALGQAANTDPLTGLLNRRALEPVLERELARCYRLGHTLCVAVIDLDGFKHVNDTLGHHAGDRLLVEATTAWRSALRTFDVLARSGGDEFLLLLPSTPPEAATVVLRRLRRLHDQRFSAGLASAEDDDTVSALLHRADDACYRAKQLGRSRTVVAASGNGSVPPPSRRPVAFRQPPLVDPMRQSG